ncbi:MAG: L,D-transpeptidase [Microcystis sp. LE19-4.1E]|jgi:lipoprotein-anchoring transpeptidase ErfK/SrfK|nr:L,D-transpeptidase [Microcystis sp. LE19-4.1E]
MKIDFSRRALLLATPFVLTGCATIRSSPQQAAPEPAQRLSVQLLDHYGPRPNERFPLSDVDLSDLEPQFLRQVVEYRGSEPPGTIIIDTSARFLFLIQENGSALRYGVGVGREGLAWRGRAYVGRKAEWPRWTPTQAMIAREPERNAKWAGGMGPGLDNPLGARALYLYRDGLDTLYRIHGTNEPWSIGTSVSSGCIRMVNQDVIDLYLRIPVGASVIVRA